MSTTILAPAVIDVGPITFENVFGQAATESPIVATMTSPFSHVAGTTYRLTADGRSGYAIRPNGELVMVFSTMRGRGDLLVADAVANGATHLDCFAGYLPALYGRHGFVTTRTEANWTPGGPAVHYMRKVA